MTKLGSPYVLLSVFLLASVALGLHWGGRTVEAIAGNVVYFKHIASTRHLDASDVADGIKDLGLTYHEAHKWEDVLDADGEAEIDALILDSGSIALADDEWIKDAYGRGVVIAGINASVLDLNELIDDPRTDDEYADSYSESWTSEYYSVTYAGVSGTSFALTAIAADPDAIESLPTPETAYMYHFFTEAETVVPDARSFPSGASVDTDSFFGNIAIGIVERNNQ